MTVISNLLSPSLTSFVPVPDTVAFESSFVAFIFIFVVLASASAVYSTVFLLNFGDSVRPSILSDFKLLFFE